LLYSIKLLWVEDFIEAMNGAWHCGCLQGQSTLVSTLKPKPKVGELIPQPAAKVTLSYL